MESGKLRLSRDTTRDATRQEINALKRESADLKLVHEVVQDAVNITGMTDVPWERRTRLLSDNGPGYISRSFGEYLRLVGIRHILALPFHPQTNGKLERYHRTIKLDVNQTPYDVPGNLELAITEFVNYYNNRRYHKALGDVTPSDVLDGRREEILERRKEVQTQTFQRRRLYNQQLESSRNQHEVSISIVSHCC